MTYVSKVFQRLQILRSTHPLQKHVCTNVYIKEHQFVENDQFSVRNTVIRYSRSFRQMFRLQILRRVTRYGQSPHQRFTTLIAQSRNSLYKRARLHSYTLGGPIFRYPFWRKQMNSNLNRGAARGYTHDRSLHTRRQPCERQARYTLNFSTSAEQTFSFRDQAVDRPIQEERRTNWHDRFVKLIRPANARNFKSRDPIAAVTTLEIRRR